MEKMLSKNRRFLRPKNEQIIKTTKPHFADPEQWKNGRGVRKILARQTFCSEEGRQIAASVVNITIYNIGHLPLLGQHML